MKEANDIIRNNVVTDEEVENNIKEIKNNVQEVFDNVDPEDIIKNFNELVENVSSIDRVKESIEKRIDDSLADLAIDVYSLSTLIHHMKFMNDAINSGETKEDKMKMAIMLNSGIDSVNSLLKSIPELSNEITVMKDTLNNIK